MRMRRNCSNEKDYEEQTEILIRTFVEKGYKRKELELRAKVKTIDREIFIKDKKKRTKNNMEWAFLAGFNRQYKQVENIMSKYWPILKSDKILKKVIPQCPKCMYRRAPTLRKKLAHNVLDPPKKEAFTSRATGKQNKRDDNLYKHACHICC